MCLRANVTEEEYALVAEVRDDGEDSYRSDRIAAAMRISGAMRARGRDSIIEEDGARISVRVPLGDASDRAFEDAAVDLLEAASW